MEGAKSARPREFKKKTFRSQEERRKAVLKRQQDARRNLTDHARMLALEELEASVLSPSVERVQQDELEAAGQEPVQMEAGSERRQKLSYWAKKRLRDFYARQLCIPEWMTEVPSDLNGSAAGQGQGWLVRCRPEGKRCLLISSKGRTISRLQHGEILHKFPSALPNGSSDSGFAQEYSILDAIFHEEDQTYYVLDVMCWKGYSLYDCTAEFRFYWLRTKLDEVECAEARPRNRFRILPVSFYECDPESLEFVYTSPTPYIKDGLLFYHKQGHYALGLTPLVLLWKDENTTRYLVYSERQTIALQVRSARRRRHASVSAVGDSQEVSIDDGEFPSGAVEFGEEFEPDSEAGADGSDGEGLDDDASSASGLDDNVVPRYNLCTLDGVVLGHMTKQDLRAAGVKPGDILRFNISGASYVHDDTTGELVPSVSDVVYEKRCSANRPVPDSWSKILFQSTLRDDPVPFEAILQIASSGFAPVTDETEGIVSLAGVDETEGIVSLAGVDETRAGSLLQKHPKRVLGHSRGKGKAKEAVEEEPVGEQTMEIPDAEFKDDNF